MGREAKAKWKAENAPNQETKKRDADDITMDPDKRVIVRIRDPEEVERLALLASIRSFTGEYDFLSSLFKCKVVLPREGVTEDDFVAYASAEHALQAAKTNDPKAREQIRACKDPLEAKRVGAKLDFDREEWKDRSLKVMEAILRDKFRRHKDLRAKLAATSPKELIYDNDHNDTFWGVSKGKGFNHLGSLLMKVRADQKDGEDTAKWARTVYGAAQESKVLIGMEVTKDGVRLEQACYDFERRALITFGKMQDNDVVVEHPSTSRYHALLVVSEVYGPVLVDLEAPNGTFVDGRRLEPLKGAKINADKVVSFGTSTRRYVFKVEQDFQLKRQAELYVMLEDPSRLLADKTDTTVFVSNLPAKVTEDDLKEFFKDCGTILELALPKKKGTDEIKGFAIVVFSTEASMVNALKLDKDPIKGEEIRVRRSKPKNKGAEAGGGGGQNPSYQSRMTDQHHQQGADGGGKAAAPAGQPGHYSRRPNEEVPVPPPLPAAAARVVERLGWKKGEEEEKGNGKPQEGGGGRERGEARGREGRDSESRRDDERKRRSEERGRSRDSRRRDDDRDSRHGRGRSRSDSRDRRHRRRHSRSRSEERRRRRRSRS